MCGHAGAAVTDISGTNMEMQSRCRQSLIHRGPDAFGSKSLTGNFPGNILMQHARLSILDLKERSNQPFSDGACHMTFNGEIYNYRELRRSLEIIGLSFKTDGDTEVLFQGLKHFGRDFLAELDGMYSISFFDTRKRSLLLARDYFGEKPLYFIKQGTDLFWGSEAEAVFAISGIEPQLDYPKLQRFLIEGYKGVFKYSNTFFTNLNQLNPNHWLEFDVNLRTFQTGLIEQPIEDTQGIERSETLAVKQASLEATIEEVFSRRLLADVPLAIALSGGVDSMLLYHLAVKMGQNEIFTFHIDTPDARYSESSYVNKYVQDPMNHYVIRPDSDGTLERIRGMVQRRGGPVLTPSALAHNRLMEAISERGLKVVLGGVGADELFSGYYDHHLLSFASADSRNSKGLLQEVNAWEKNVKPHVRNPLLSDPGRYIKNPKARDHVFFRADEYRSSLGVDLVSVFTENDYGLSLLRNRMLNEMYCETVPVMLEEEDRNAMQFSIENRSPFLAKSMLQAALKFSDKELLNNGLSKQPLRNFLMKFAPEVALNSRKIGFNSPVAEQLASERANVLDLLLDVSPKLGLRIDPDFAKGLTSPRNSNSDSKLLLSLLSSCIFVQEFSG